MGIVIDIIIGGARNGRTVAGKNQHRLKDVDALEVVQVDTVTTYSDNEEVEDAVLPEVKPVVWVETSDATSMRSHIFNTHDLKEELVDVPEWHVQILVRGMTAKQRSRVLMGAMKPDGTPDLEKMYPDMVIASAHHPADRKLIFGPADRDELNNKAGGVLERLAMTCARLSGLDQEQANAIRKN